jgi:glycosyltransferase involved in cell wall biosynthesis
MKIAFIGQKGIPAKFGGVERYIEKIAIKMAKDGHEVFVYVRNNYTAKNIKKYKGVRLIHLPSIGTKNLDAISHTLLATIHALFKNLDVIHFVSIGPTSLSFIIKVLKRNTILVSTFQCQDYYHQKWGLLARTYLKFGEYMTCKIPDKTIVVSKVLQKYVRNAYKKDAEFIPNGAEIKSIASSNALKKWGLKDKKYIVYIGRLIKHKGVHYLIEAFKQLEDTSRLPNNFKLVITGDGFHTDDYVKYLKMISEGRENIIFTGNQTGKSLEQLFVNAYLFVQPSEAEGLSLALLEAMGYGTAPIVSDIPENIEAIGKAGFTFKAKDIDDLIKKLAYLLNRPQEVEMAGKSAKKEIEENYSWDSITGKIIKVYRDLQSEKLKLRYDFKTRKI